MPDVTKLLADSESVFAKCFEAEMVASMERSYRLISMFPPSPPSVSEIAARHFPRLAVIVRAPERVRLAIARARYALGVRVIGYDPAPDEDL